MSPPPGIPPELPSTGDFVQGLALGVWDGVKSMATGLYDLGAMSVDGYKQLGALGKELYDDPQAREMAMQAVKDIANEAKDFAEYLAEDPQQTIATAKEGVLAAANAAKAKGKELLDQERQAYAEALAKGEGSKFIGRAFGRTVFEVGSLFVGVGQAAKAGKLAKVSELSKMSKAETFVLPCGKMVTKAEFEAAEAAAKSAQIAMETRAAHIARAGEIESFSVRGVDGMLLKAQRIRAGTNGKVAVIGRTMGESNKGYSGVRDYAAALRKQGMEIELFDGDMIPDFAKAQMDILTDGGRIRLPDEEVLETAMFAQNKIWAQKLVDEGYTVVDLGDFANRGFSPFYDIERMILFGN